MAFGAPSITRRLILLGLLCRALVPAGFMPAALADGGPIRVCHGGAAGALVDALAEVRQAARAAHGTDAHHTGHADSTHDRPTSDGHDPHAAHADAPSGAPASSGGAEHDSDAQHATWEHCPAGTAFAFAALIGAVGFEFLALEHAFHRFEPQCTVRSAAVRSYHARAPPAV